MVRRQNALKARHLQVSVFAYVGHNILCLRYVSHDAILLFLRHAIAQEEVKPQVINEGLLRKSPPLHPVNVNGVNVKRVIE